MIFKNFFYSLIDDFRRSCCCFVDYVSCNYHLFILTNSIGTIYHQTLELKVSAFRVSAHASADDLLIFAPLSFDLCFCLGHHVEQPSTLLGHMGSF